MECCKMNHDEASAFALILGLLLGYAFYKTGMYRLDFVDYFAVVVATIAIPFFVYLFLKARFR